jgi:hypothetical protein
VHARQGGEYVKIVFQTITERLVYYYRVVLGSQVECLVSTQLFQIWSTNVQGSPLLNVLPKAKIECSVVPIKRLVTDKSRVFWFIYLNSKRAFKTILNNGCFIKESPCHPVLV